MENNRKGCINRDKNGCKNTQKVFKSYMETGERPEKYRRDYQINKSPQTASVIAVKLGQAQDFLNTENG